MTSNPKSPVEYEIILMDLEGKLRESYVLCNNAEKLADANGYALASWMDLAAGQMRSVMMMVCSGDINANVAQRWINRDLSEHERFLFASNRLPLEPT